MANSSKESLLKWLEVASRVVGWDALVVINRTKLNNIITRDYIERFSVNSYLPLISGTAPMSEDREEVLKDVALDHPRLSFNNANLNYSTAIAAMRIVGGSEVTLQAELDVLRPIRIDSIDPLDGPTLEMVVNLHSIQAIVGAGRVAVLDLADASDFKVNYTSYEAQQQKLGFFFEAEFKKFSADQKTFPLSTLQDGGEELMVPTSFEIRTQPIGDSVGNWQSDDYGDGAVILFVTMEKGDIGGFPGPDFRYLIPNDVDGDYSATVLMSHRLVSRALFVRGLKKAITTFNGTLAEHIVGGKLESIRATAGVATADAGELESSYLPGRPWRIFYDKFSISLSNLAKPLQADLTGKDIMFEWSDNVALSGTIILLQNNQEIRFQANCAQVNSRRYSLLDSGAGSWEQFMLTPEYLNVSWVVTGLPPLGSHSDDIKSALERMVGHFAGTVTEEIGKEFYSSAALEKVLSNCVRIPYGSALEFDSMHFPDDVALFGKVSPSITMFNIDPLEVIVGHSSSYSFKTTPSVAGLQWKVEHIPGGVGEAGDIDKVTGLYTAPGSNEIKGTYLRVKVTATAPNGYTSSALVSVVVRDITVNPVIQVCSAYDATKPAAQDKRQLWAGTLGSGLLNWSMVGDTDGRIVINDEPRNGHNYLAMSKITGEGVVLEEIKVTNLLTNKSQSSFVLVKHKAMLLSLNIVSAISSLNEITLEAQLGDDIILPTKWVLLKGPGAINVDGVYSLGEQFQDYFAVVKAEFLSFVGFLIIPLPLAQFSEVIQRMDVKKLR